MTLQEAKDQVAKKHRFKDWEDVVLQFQAKNYVDEVAELYARSKWVEACESQKLVIWDSLKVRVTPPQNVLGDVVSATYIVRAIYEHAPKPEFKP